MGAGFVPESDAQSEIQVADMDPLSSGWFLPVIIAAGVCCVLLCAGLIILLLVKKRSAKNDTSIEAVQSNNEQPQGEEPTGIYGSIDQAICGSLQYDNPRDSGVYSASPLTHSPSRVHEYGTVAPQSHNTLSQVYEPATSALD